MALAKAVNDRQTSIEKKKCVTPEFRVSYPNVFKPKAFNNGEPKYSLVMLFDKKTPLKENLRRAAHAAAVEKFGPKEQWPKKFKMPFRDGDEEKPGTEGYENVIFVAASSKNPVGIVNQRREDILDQSAFYAGCYARAEVIAYAYDQQGNRGVGFALLNVQKLRDGKPFAGRKPAAAVFDEVKDTSDDEDSYDDSSDDDDDDDDEDVGF